MGAPATVTLDSGRATAEIAPPVGARLMRWSVNGRPVLHWPEAADWSAPAKIRGGNPLLFPLIARTFLDGKPGLWRDPEGRVRPAPRHGLVRAARFETVELDGSHLVMRAAREDSMAEAWPFPFIFTVSYALDETTLAADFTVENTGDRTMPYSAGHHFYFDLPAAERGDWRLEGEFRACARQDAAGRIVSAGAPPGGGVLSDPEMVDLFHIGLPARGTLLRNRADGREVVFGSGADGDNPWYAVTTWTESPSSDFYCVEPWTALPDAVHNGRGLRLLKPGARETLRLRLTARGW